jgi:hypothetical protein
VRGDVNSIFDIEHYSNDTVHLKQYSLITVTSNLNHSSKIND